MTFNFSEAEGDVYASFGESHSAQHNSHYYSVDLVSSIVRRS